MDPRRRLFDREVNIWDEFLRTINGVLLVEGTNDRVIWAPSSFNKSSCRFCSRMIAGGHTFLDRWRVLWNLFVHFKVNVFVGF